MNDVWNRFLDVMENLLPIFILMIFVSLVIYGLLVIIYQTRMNSRKRRMVDAFENILKAFNKNTGEDLELMTSVGHIRCNIWHIGTVPHFLVEIKNNKRDSIYPNGIIFKNSAPDGYNTKQGVEWFIEWVKSELYQQYENN